MSRANQRILQLPRLRNVVSSSRSRFGCKRQGSEQIEHKSVTTKEAMIAILQGSVLDKSKASVWLVPSASFLSGLSGLSGLSNGVIGLASGHVELLMWVVCIGRARRSQAQTQSECHALADEHYIGTSHVGNRHHSQGKRKV